MSTATPATDPRVIDAPERIPDWSEWDSARGAAVKKIVVGQLGDEAKEKPLALGPLPHDFALLFPSLTHLYLWNCKDLVALPPLPAGLECLDVRGCRDLQGIEHLPKMLDCLVVAGCPALRSLPVTSQLACPQLRDLELTDLLPAAATEQWLLHLLASASELRELDLSGCAQLTRLTDWPRDLRRAKFNRCTQLKALPDYWPECLTRIELAGTAVERLPELTPSIDYVNLAGATKLRQLDKDWRVRSDERPTPRTLYLFRSGLLMPPASEQGEGATENVAAATRGYFEDVDLTGKGEVKRCKILMLGNGGAGKTSLSMALQPDCDPADAVKLGSTPGLKLWDWVCRSEVSGQISKIHRHIWDFGGQEIYHNAHRLFMGAGAVFVVLWRPEHDGQDAPAGNTGYIDEWRPLRYWLDFIHLACPHRPRVAVVCSFHADREVALEERFRQAVGSRYADCPLYFVDSRWRRGELSELHAWLDRTVAEVIRTQGTAVPAYWEIAQDLVESWVARLSVGTEFAATHNELSLERFGQELADEVRRVLDNEKTGRFRKLKDALRAGTFTVDSARVRRTLSFLTHSGWLYWDPRLFGERVIVGQAWALEGIYAALDRREQTVVFRTLRDEWGGRFTREKLAQLAWAGRDYNPDQQRLLLSFMEHMGLCFTLVSGRESLWGEPVYVSVAHLKTAQELGLSAEFFGQVGALAAERAEIQDPFLHAGRWFAILAALGAAYGTEAEYARDAFLLRSNAEGQSVLLQAVVDKGGIGGVVYLAILGSEAAKTKADLEAKVRALLDPDAPAKLSELGKGNEALVGTRTNRPSVFVSYTWQPRPGEIDFFDGLVTDDYEAPVRYLREALKPEKERVELLIDKDIVRDGVNVMKFMDVIKTTDRVLIVHSDKYWRSPYCVFEITSVIDSLTERRATIQDTVLMLELPSSGAWGSSKRKLYLDFWRNWSGDMPACLETAGLTPTKLVIAAQNLLENSLPKIHAANVPNRLWDSNSPEGIVAWMKQKVGLTSGAPAPTHPDD